MTAEQIAETLLVVRERLTPPPTRKTSAGRALAAAAMAAVSALSLAAAVILGPGLEAKDASPPTIFGDR